MQQDIETKRIRIRELEEEICQTRQRVYSMEDELHKIVQELQKVCKHDYIRERDGDYHRPRWEYTCRICKHYTKSTPPQYEKNITT